MIFFGVCLLHIGNNEVVTNVKFCALVLKQSGVGTGSERLLCCLLGGLDADVKNRTEIDQSMLNGRPSSSSEDEAAVAFDGAWDICCDKLA